MTEKDKIESKNGYKLTSIADNPFNDEQRREIEDTLSERKMSINKILFL